MGSKSKDKRRKQPKMPVETISSLRGVWTQAEPLWAFLSQLRKDLTQRSENCKIIGSPEKAKIHGALALIDTIAETVVSHSILGDLIPLRVERKDDDKTVTEATQEPSQEGTLGEDTKEDKTGQV